MKVKKISYKLFAALSLFIVVLLIGIFFFQSFFLQSFYFEKTVSMIAAEMDQLVKDYEKENWSDYELGYHLDNFRLDNNASAFIEQIYEIETYESLVLVGQDTENVTWYVLTASYLINDYLEGKIPSTDDTYFISGFMVHEDQNYLIAEYIGENDVEEQLNISLEESAIKDRQVDLYREDGIFNGILKINEVKDIDEFKEFHEYSFLIDTDEHLYEHGEKVYLDSNTYFYIDYEPFYSTTYVRIVKEILINNDEQELIVEVNLQSIDQAISILKYYYLYFLFLAVVLVFIFAMIFSKWFTKPLVKMSQIASKMANMDFSEKVMYQSEDEMGSLANDLNVLSSSLHQKIHQLNDANAQLKDDIEKERKQEKVRKEFVANVSHELKTPLGIIKSYSEAIRDGVKKEKHDYYLKVIIDEVQEMNQLVVSMLELSKIEAKNKMLKLEPVNLKHMMVSTMNALELACNDKNLSWEMMGEFEEVIADKSKIEQVINNLLSNAVKYSNDNSTIKINSQIKGKKCLFEITNACEPLSEEALSNIWNRFYKADQSHHREFGGTGLGLAIVKAILEAHKNNFGVVQDQRGLTFYFELDTVLKES